jgi:hypothetical protein
VVFSIWDRYGRFFFFARDAGIAMFSQLAHGSSYLVRNRFRFSCARGTNNGVGGRLSF